MKFRECDQCGIRIEAGMHMYKRDTQFYCDADCLLDAWHIGSQHLDEDDCDQEDEEDAE